MPLESPPLLPSDPLPGTQVRFRRPVRMAKTGDVGTLVRSMRRPGLELPNDPFVIQFGNEVFMAERRDLEVASPRPRAE